MKKDRKNVGKDPPAARSRPLCHRVFFPPGNSSDDFSGRAPLCRNRPRDDRLRRLDYGAPRRRPLSGKAGHGFLVHRWCHEGFRGERLFGPVPLGAGYGPLRAAPVSPGAAGNRGSIRRPSRFRRLPDVRHGLRPGDVQHTRHGFLPLRHRDARLFFSFRTERNGSQKRSLFLSLAGVFLGLGFLTKGLVALVIPVLTVTPFMIWERKFIELLKLFWIPLAAAAVVALPWSILIHLKNSDFLALLHLDISHRAVHRGDLVHKSSFGAVLVLFAHSIGGHAAVDRSAAVRCFRYEKRRPHTAALSILTVLARLPARVLFRLLRQAGNLYPAPLLPAAAVLFTLGLLSFFETAHNKSFSYGVAFLGTVLGLALIYLVVSFFFHNPDIALFSRPEWPKTHRRRHRCRSLDDPLDAIIQNERCEDRRFLHSPSPRCFYWYRPR